MENTSRTPKVYGAQPQFVFLPRWSGKLIAPAKTIAGIAPKKNFSNVSIFLDSEIP
jgi:hypothetical protein